MAADAAGRKPQLERSRVGASDRDGIDGVDERRERSNRPVEGINNKLRVIARRAYGFHSAGSMLFLCCGGIELAPPLPTLF